MLQFYVSWLWIGDLCRASLTGVMTISGLCAWGQAHSRIPSQPSVDDALSLEVAFNYETIHANTVPSKNFWMNGGSVQVTGHFMRHWGVTADNSGVILRRCRARLRGWIWLALSSDRVTRSLCRVSTFTSMARRWEERFLAYIVFFLESKVLPIPRIALRS
jgi:hypothetical protein